ncbi:MAG: phospholipase D family protein [Candidatus Omnitrophota bacterium]|nr:phospholipase D family protein [Candidatus Omnitrophota bacterium]
MRQRRGVLAVACAAAFLLAGAPAWAGEVHVYTDREIREALLELLNGAQRSIDVEMYVLTDDEVVTALERAEARGVQVRVILDPNQSSNQKHVERLKVHGVEVKWFPVNKPAQMHRKLAIVDGKRLFAGSVNWSYNGLARNEELMLLVEDAEIARKLDEIFAGDWYQSWLGHQPEY